MGWIIRKNVPNPHVHKLYNVQCKCTMYNVQCTVYVNSFCIVLPSFIAIKMQIYRLDIEI